MIAVKKQASNAARAKVALYRTKAAEMRKRAASADPNVHRAILINVAETYEHIAKVIEEIESKRFHPDRSYES
jgi:hypothetical protein